MARYDHDGISFEAPDDWTDRTMLAVVAPAPPGTKNAPNMIMTQERMREGDTLRTHADRQLMELAKQLNGFEILDSRDTTVCGLPAITMNFAWGSPMGNLVQTMTLVERSTPMGRSIISFTGTSPSDVSAQCAALWSQMLRSVRIGPPPAPGEASSRSAQPAAPSSVEYIPIPGLPRERR
jgi:hypothetical protein